MPRTVLTVQTSSRLAATVPTAQAVDAVNGSSLDNSSQRVWLRVTKAAGSDVTMTVVIPGDYESIARPDLPFTVASGTTKVFGPWTSAYDNNDTDNDITQALYIDWSTATGVTVEVFELGTS